MADATLLKIPELKKRHALSGAQKLSRKAAQRVRADVSTTLHRNPLLPVAMAAGLGIAADEFLHRYGAMPALGAQVATWIVIGGVGILMSAIRGRRPAGLLALLLFFAVGGAAHAVQRWTFEQNDLYRLAGEVPQPMVAIGVVDRPVTLRRHPLAGWRDQGDQPTWQTQLVVSVRRVRLSRTMVACRGRVLAVVNDRCDDLRPGDRIKMFGSLSSAGRPTNPGEIDRRASYRRRSLHARFEIDDATQIQVESRGIGPRYWCSRAIAALADRARRVLMRDMTIEDAALAAALVLGQRELVDEQTRDLLLVTGTAHLLSVSGLHLAIVVAMAGWLAAMMRVSFFWRVALLVATCCLYTAITGARPPVVRAAILVGTLMIALVLKRPSQPLNTLALAALILMMVNPSLVFSVGVMLSFLAVTTLVLCGNRGAHHGDAVRSPATRDAVDREKKFDALVQLHRGRLVRYLHACTSWLSQAVWYSSCVTLVSAPLVWQHFHILSPISIVTNVVLGPFLCVALASGIFTVLVGLVHESMSFLPAMMCELSILAMRRIIESAAMVPGGHHWLPSPPSAWVLVFYVVLALTLLLPRGNRARIVRGCWWVVWMTSAWWIATSPPPTSPESLEATFIDVGHGTCVVLRLGGEQTWLYDCGRLGNASYSSRGIDSTLWSMGVTRLDGVFLSHADADHFNALPGILRRFDVRALYTPPGMLQEDEPAVQQLLPSIAMHRTRVVELSRGDSLAAAQITASVLHPPVRRVGGSDNANSLVLRMDCSGKVLILPGDLEPPGTDHLMQCQRPPPGGVLMAPHHGSLRMDAGVVLQWARPRATVVSGGRRASRPEVDRMLSATGSSVHVTHQVGAVQVTIGGQGEVKIRHWRPSGWQNSANRGGRAKMRADSPDGSGVFWR